MLDYITKYSVCGLSDKTHTWIACIRSNYW